MTSCCGSEYAEQTQAKGNYQQYGVRSYLHQVAFCFVFHRQWVIWDSIQKIIYSFPVSFMRSARLQSGNAMKIFRFRDHLAGGALYSGRWGEIPTSYWLCLVGLPTLMCNSFHIYFPPFQVCLVFGTLILLAGLIVVLVGYATPTRIEAFGGDDLLFVDR